jgi:hypothetical protein
MENKISNFQLSYNYSGNFTKGNAFSRDYSRHHILLLCCKQKTANERKNLEGTRSLKNQKDENEIKTVKIDYIRIFVILNFGTYGQ